MRERRVDGTAAHKREGALHEEHPVAYTEKAWFERGRREKRNKEAKEDEQPRGKRSKPGAGEVGSIVFSRHSM